MRQGQTRAWLMFTIDQGFIIYLFLSFSAPSQSFFFLFLKSPKLTKIYEVWKIVIIHGSITIAKEYKHNSFKIVNKSIRMMDQ